MNNLIQALSNISLLDLRELIDRCEDAGTVQASIGIKAEDANGNAVFPLGVIAFTDEKLFDEVNALVAERIKASGGAIDTATITEAALNDEDGEMLEAERWSPLYNDLPEDGE